MNSLKSCQRDIWFIVTPELSWIQAGLTLKTLYQWFKNNVSKSYLKNAKIIQTSIVISVITTYCNTNSLPSLDTSRTSVCITTSYHLITSHCCPIKDLPSQVRFFYEFFFKTLSSRWGIRTIFSSVVRCNVGINLSEGLRTREGSTARRAGTTGESAARLARHWQRARHYENTGRPARCLWAAAPTTARRGTHAGYQQPPTQRHNVVINEDSSCEICSSIKILKPVTYLL